MLCTRQCSQLFLLAKAGFVLNLLLNFQRNEPRVLIKLFLQKSASFHCVYTAKFDHYLNHSMAQYDVTLSPSMPHATITDVTLEANILAV